MRFRLLPIPISNSSLSCRRKKDGNVFLVAFYECEDDYDLESIENDRLYCSKDAWIGVRPRCVRIAGTNGHDDYDENGDGDEDDVEEGDEDENAEEEEEDDDGEGDSDSRRTENGM